jgi:hypothetical protein
MEKAWLTHKIHDLDMGYVKIMCLLCVLDHDIMII